MILSEIRDGVALLTLARPEKANSLTRAMLGELVEQFQRFAGEVEAVIVTGQGKVFSAGADLDEARAGLATDPIWEELSSTVAAFPGLTIAALNGTLAGGANGLALACDIRLAVPEARFFYPVMRLGYLPQPSDAARLTALIGAGRARMILLAGEKIGAEEALAWGVIERIVQPDALLPAAFALTASAAAAPKGHAGRMKAMIGSV